MTTSIDDYKPDEILQKHVANAYFVIQKWESLRGGESQYVLWIFTGEVKQTYIIQHTLTQTVELTKVDTSSSVTSTLLVSLPVALDRNTPHPLQSTHNTYPQAQNRDENMWHENRHLCKAKQWGVLWSFGTWHKWNTEEMMDSWKLKVD